MHTNYSLLFCHIFGKYSQFFFFFFCFIIFSEIEARLTTLWISCTFSSRWVLLYLKPSFHTWAISLYSSWVNCPFCHLFFYSWDFQELSATLVRLSAHWIWRDMILEKWLKCPWAQGPVHVRLFTAVWRRSQSPVFPHDITVLVCPMILTYKLSAGSSPICCFHIKGNSPSSPSKWWMHVDSPR